MNHPKLQEILTTLKAKPQGSQWIARCPAHKDKSPSLSVAQGDKGILLACHAGCSVSAIASALGFKVKDLFNPKEKPAAPTARRKIIKIYDYRDEMGTLLYQAVRFEPKGFSQRQPSGGGWKWELNGVRRVLYRLPELLQADRSEPVFVVEGEKDVDNLRALGLVAVCNPQGAGKWKEEFSEFLRDRKVVVLADNDQPGRDHADAVAASTRKTARSVRVLSFNREIAGIAVPDKGDVSDWLKAGGTKEQLLAEVAKLAEWQPAVDPKRNKRVICTATIDFIVDERGLWATEDGETTLVCSPLFVEAYTRDVANDQWGKLLRLVDPDGIEHTYVLPAAHLAGEGQIYREQLLNLGLEIRPGLKPKRFLDAYLRIEVKEKARCVDKIGWYENAFIFPDETLGASDNERIYLQADSAGNHLLKSSGTLDEWKDAIGRYCIDNQRMTFVVAAAFAASLLTPLHTESGGFHFYGYSSRGKSTLQYIAGSVWGGGSSKGFLKRWRTTSNGLESVAAYHNDSLLCLDEIGECDARELGAIVYMLGNGQGKIRSQKMGGVRRVLEWQNLVISSGEKTIEAHIQTANQKTYAGQEVRMVNIPAEAAFNLGVFDHLHTFKSGEAFSKHLREASVRLYGTPIREFLRKVIGQNLLEKLKLDWKTFKAKFVRDCEQPEMGGEVYRVLERFALVAYAGTVATTLGITGWPESEAAGAAKALFNDWLVVRGTAGSTVEVESIRRVKAFIEKGANRFQRIRGVTVDPNRIDDAPEAWQDSPLQVRDRIGFVKPNENGEIVQYHFLPEAFRDEVCAGADYRQVLNALKKANLLHCQNNRDQYALRIPEKSSPVRVYSISASILD